MTAAVLLLSAVERLKHLLEGETAAPDGVEQLNSDLGRLADTLCDADGELNRQGRELAYDIEDSVECFVWRSNVSDKWRCFFSSYGKSFAEDVEAFSRKGRAIVDSISAVDGASHSLLTAEPQRIDRQPIRESNTETLIVDQEIYYEKLRNQLLREEAGLSVIAIVGMGGIGKTTLARRAYSDGLMKAVFQYCGWVSISPEYRPDEVLRGILSSIEGKEAAFTGLGTMELAQMLYKTLKRRRYLITLDDVWSAQAWDSLRFVFPDDNNGSRIVITTRSHEVALHGSMSVPPLSMDVLSDEGTWQLFLIKSGMRDDPGWRKNTQVEEIRRIVVRLCHGLPLAITAIANTLSTRSWQNWVPILQKLDQSYLDDDSSRINSLLHISYTELPFRLKPCFLYMGYFPPDQPIMVDKLHLLWMAEGLISKTKEPVAEYYLEEFVNRSLVLVKKNEDMLASSWYLHGQIRNFCLNRGKQEDIFEVIDFSHAKETSSSTRRLAVYLHMFKDSNDVALNIADVQSIRSILFHDAVECVPESTWPSEFADLTDFLHIRLLDFDGVNFHVKGLPRGIEKLIYLRHLSFRGCYLQLFPSSFGNFPFLETLDLRVMDSCTMTILSNILRKLVRLRHLYLPLQFQCDGKEKLKLDCLKHLQVVENFDTDSCDTEDLQRLENLQILTGIVHGNNLDLKNIIKKMNSTGQISLVVKGFDCYSKERLSILTELLASDALHSLDLEGHLEVSPHDIAFGSSFTNISFDGSEFSKDPMPVLGKLPNLKSLVLCNDAFVQVELVCHESDFPQLKSLKLATLQYLKEWEVERGAMPNLTILTIEQCERLDTLPGEVLCNNLHKLMIGSMPKTFHRKVEQVIQDQESCGVDCISPTFYDC